MFHFGRILSLSQMLDKAKNNRQGQRIYRNQRRRKKMFYNFATRWRCRRNKSTSTEKLWKSFRVKKVENVVKIDRVVLPAVQTSRFSHHLKLVGAERKKFLREISLTRKAQTYELWLSEALVFYKKWNWTVLTTNNKLFRTCTQKAECFLVMFT